MRKQRQKQSISSLNLFKVSNKETGSLFPQLFHTVGTKKHAPLDKLAKKITPIFPFFDKNSADAVLLQICS